MMRKFIRELFCRHRYANLHTWRYTGSVTSLPSWGKEWVSGTCKKCGKRISLLTGK